MSLLRHMAMARLKEHAAADKSTYTWFIYRGERGKRFKTAKGVTVLLRDGERFGLQPAPKNTHRLITETMGASVIVRLSEDQKDALIGVSRKVPAKANKATGDVPFKPIKTPKTLVKVAAKEPPKVDAYQWYIYRGDRAVRLENARNEYRLEEGDRFGYYANGNDDTVIVEELGPKQIFKLSPSQTKRVLQSSRKTKQPQPKLPKLKEAPKPVSIVNIKMNADKPKKTKPKGAQTPRALKLQLNKAEKQRDDTKAFKRTLKVAKSIQDNIMREVQYKERKDAAKSMLHNVVTALREIKPEIINFWPVVDAINVGFFLKENDGYAKRKNVHTVLNKKLKELYGSDLKKLAAGYERASERLTLQIARKDNMDVDDPRLFYYADWVISQGKRAYDSAMQRGNYADRRDLQHLGIVDRDGESNEEDALFHFVFT